jgi:dTDP-4-dehydrorhamnose reductase
MVRSVVVVGRNGALGELLTAALGARGVDLRHPGEALDAQVPELAQADVVVNVAGPRVRPGLGWAEYLREHVGTASAVARAMHEGAHLVHFSSAAVYGAQPGRIAAGAAEAPLSFPNPSYAWAKLAGELAVRAICRERRVALSVVRPAMVYGAGVPSAIDTMIGLARRGVLFDLRPPDTVQHALSATLLVRAVEKLVSDVVPMDAPLPLADPFVFTNQELSRAIGRRHPRAVRVPAPLPIAESLLRKWPTFPARDAPGALAALAFLGLGNEFDWRPLFSALALDPSTFAREKTLDPYLESAA